MWGLNRDTSLFNPSHWIPAFAGMTRRGLDSAPAFACLRTTHRQAGTTGEVAWGSVPHRGGTLHKGEGGAT